MGSCQHLVSALAMAKGGVHFLRSSPEKMVLFFDRTRGDKSPWSEMVSATIGA